MYTRSPRRQRAVAAVAVAGLILSACESGDIAGPRPDPEPSFDALPGLPQDVTLCLVNDAGQSATFSVSGSPAGVGGFTDGGTMVVQSMAEGNMDLTKCRRAWVAVSPGDPAVELTITLNAQPDIATHQIVAFYGTQQNITLDNPSTATVTFPVSYVSGGMVIFRTRRVEVPPPPPVEPGKQGCSVEYWRDKASFGNWTRPYSPTLKFVYAFWLNVFPSKTLHQVLKLEGGGLNAVGREAVAALLNAASPEVSYYLKPVHVAAAVWWAVFTKRYDRTAAVLHKLNGLSCPL